jgi:hypothetical protein
LIKALSRLCALKIDFGGAKSRMGDLFVSGLSHTGIKLKKQTKRLGSKYKRHRFAD